VVRNTPARSSVRVSRGSDFCPKRAATALAQRKIGLGRRRTWRTGRTCASLPRMATWATPVTGVAFCPAATAASGRRRHLRFSPYSSSNQSFTHPSARLLRPAAHGRASSGSGCPCRRSVTSFTSRDPQDNDARTLASHHTSLPSLGSR
jgi:hypothetical protein